MDDEGNRDKCDKESADPLELGNCMTQKCPCSLIYYTQSAFVMCLVIIVLCCDFLSVMRRSLRYLQS